MMCGHGIDFGLPYIPNEFGYPKMTHQYRNSLSDVSVRRGTCADPDAQMIQKPMPLQPMYLKSGMVVPFSGDLDALAGMLNLMKPKSVVLGGAWGQTDLFATPFGERYGVQIHAAALAGAINSDVLSPFWLELVLSWVFISFVTTCMYYTSRFMNKQAANVADNMVGHVFFVERLKPIALIVLAFMELYLLMELLSMPHAASGFWISTAKISGTLVVCLLVPWNMGRAEPTRYRSLGETMKNEVVSPIQNDLKTLGQCVHILSGKLRRWEYQNGDLPMSKGRAFFEGTCALVSLLFQTVFPLVSLTFIIYDSVAG